MYIVGEEEVEAVAKVIRSGKLLRYGHGDQCDTFERRYAEYLGVKHVRMTCSASYSMHAALSAFGIGPGDEVIVPAHTYMATATSVLTVGAIPVIVDIDESITIDPQALDDAVGPHTKAVIPVHMWGTACNMDAIMRVADKHGIRVLEDSSQAIGGGYKGRMFGSIGHAGAFSFNYYKNISAGEGGAAATSDGEIDRRIACSIDPCRHYWTGRTGDFRPFADNGARASELLAAVLNVQLDRLPGMIAAMRSERRRVLEGTKHLDDLGLKSAPMNSPDHDCAAHVLYAMPSEDIARKFVEVLPSVIAGRTGRHNYTEWDQILLNEGASHPVMNPYNMEANKDCRRSYSKGMCQRSLDILNRTVLVPTDPEHTDAQTEQLISNIEAAARVAFGEVGREDVEIAGTGSWDPTRYDEDGLSGVDGTPTRI